MNKKPIHPLTPANADAWIGTSFVLIEQRYGRPPTKDEVVQLANASAAGADQDGLRAIMDTWPAPTPIEAPAVAEREERGFLRVGGPERSPYFVDEDNQPWQLRGYSTHLFLPEMAKRDLAPIIAEAKGYGYNTLITIGTHLSQWKRDNGFVMDPLSSDYPERLARMFDMAAEQKMRVAHAVLADAQFPMTGDQQRRIIAISAAVMRGRWNVIARKGNESNVNGWDPFGLDFGDLGGVLWSQGSSGEGNVPHFPHGDFSEWESRRQPFHKSMDDSGAGILEQHSGYKTPEGVQFGPWRCPVVMIEGKYFHDTPQDKWGDHRDTDPALALAQGLQIGASCAGGGFGASDSNECLPLQPNAAECARQQARGMKAAFLR